MPKPSDEEIREKARATATKIEGMVFENADPREIERVIKAGLRATWDAALEEAAQLVADSDERDDYVHPDDIAKEIRALKEKP